MQTSKASNKNWVWQCARALCLVVFAVGLVRTAWVAEDAFITFRTVDNFFNGFGLRWNAAERVQTYSHPLWMILLSVGRFISGEYYFASLSLAVLFTAIALYWTGFRLSASVAGGVCALLILAFSKAFVEYSTSGLEAPLTHCLIVLFAGQLFLNGDAKSRLFRMACIASLAAVNRVDTLALFGPALLWACYRVGFRQSVRTLIVGFLPLFAWVGFATLYYGTPIPVTGFAKAMTGLPQSALFAQGLLFFQDALVRDPITLPAMVLGLGLALRKGAAEIALALGALLYCVYLLKIGGGYMAGRFLTPPLLVATILIARSVVPATRFWKPAALIATSVVLGFMCKTAPILSGSDFSARGNPVSDSVIVDERGQWYPRTGLLSESRDIPIPNGLEAMLGVDL
ncbi:MAG: arabinofuranosyltransferase, partial [Planctomycetota bacterium]